jgi:glutathione peroxidase
MGHATPHPKTKMTRLKAMHKILAILATLMGSTMTAQSQTLHNFTLTGIDGKPMPMSQFKGKAVLMVNTASKCGFTPQYEGLEALWQNYKDKGLVIVGVPSDDFGGQEPGKAEEIANFCKLNYGVTFPLADKTVVSGQSAHPAYVWASEQAGMLGKPKWNFHKFLFDKQGNFINWYASPTEPQSAKITSAIDKALSQ